jgi:uncharacterized protein involved in outer membrane biogenesis
MTNAYSQRILKYRKHFLGLVVALCVYAALGFFLAPWLIKKNAILVVDEQLGAGLDIDAVAINPFVLSMRVDGLHLRDASGDSLATIEQVFINFQLSSLFRRAWTFDQVHFIGPDFFVVRDQSGKLNLASLMPAPAAEQKESPDEDTAPARLLIFDFVVRDSTLRWDDLVPIDPVHTVLGPINIEISELNTLPQRAGQQTVVITTDTQGTLTWSGSLQLNPINSSGRATITGSHFPLTSAYMRHESGLDIVEGTANAGLDYSIATRADGTIRATIDNFNLALYDVLVRSFHGLNVDGVTERDLFSIPSIELIGGALRWPEQTVELESLAISDATVSLYRGATGELDFGTTAEADPAVDQVSPGATTNQGSSGATWKILLRRFVIEEMSVGLQDDSVQPSADVGVDSLNISVMEISNDLDASFPTELSMIPRSGGSVTLNGTMTVLPELRAEFDLAIDTLALATSHPYLRPLADVNLDSGDLNLSGRLQSSPDDRLQLSGDLSIVDFLITETDEGSRLGSWSRFDARQFAFTSSGQSLEVSEIQLHEPYGDILIAEDGSVNLGRVRKSDGTDEDDSTDADTEDVESASGADATSSPFAVTIGKVVVTDAAADFTDLSLPLPFAAKIAELNGDLTTIATGSSEPSTVALEGKVDEFGFVRISGFVTPLDTSRNTDLNVVFQNVEMPKFSAYTIPFAGREIASGRLDLDLGYKVTASELVGENNVVLRDLELGDKVEHPGAMSLPLGLAVALLKDSEGKIDMDLPVRGNVDDPEFRYGGVVLKALGNLIIKIVASPFALLGNLLGVEASELEYITFLPGRADLTPPELERAGKLAEALALRPELALELHGVIDRDIDGLALMTTKLDAIVEERNALSVAGETDEAMHAQQRREVLEQMFSELQLNPRSAVALDTLRAEFTSSTEETDDDASSVQFDELAYTAELRQRLIEAQQLDEAELAALGNERAENTRLAILAADPGLGERIIIGGPQSIESDVDEGVRMKATLRAGSNDAVEETD